jgi:ssDNA-binding Zn-finger/Zn-ribbon topoisomerase 1
MTCFDKVLSSEWHKVARCIQGMVSKGKGMLTSAFYWNKYCQNLIKRRIIK